MRLALPPLALATLLLPAPAADANRGPCVLGTKEPKCHHVAAKVGPVHDGDTFSASFKGSNGMRLVRINGLQAMELHKYGRRGDRKGECNGVKATDALEKMIRNRKVRLVVQDLSSITQGHRNRLRRTLMVKRNVRWIDPGAELLRRGLALWSPNAQEWAWNKKYSTLAAKAQRRGKGIWNSTSCGTGPSQANPLSMKVKWDADGVDSKNINGEWVRISNGGSTAVSLRKWWLRDSHLRRFTFPGNAKIPARDSIRVFIGRGSNGGNSFHWGLHEPVFENVVGGPHAAGDGAYLFDPKGDLRAYVQYPCRIACSDPAKGKVRVQATASGNEFITITNTSSQRVELTYYELESVPWFYEFEPRTILSPGQALILYIEKGPARRNAIVKNWNFGKLLLADRKDAVTLRNPLGAPVACDSWGGVRCPGV